MKSKKRLSVLVILAVMVAMLALPMSAYAAVKINKTKATVEVGKTVTLKITGAKKGTKIKWTTNKKAVATVSSKGVVKGVKAGKAKITAKVGKKNYNCTVTVKSSGGGSTTSDLTTLKTVRIEPYYLEDDVMHIGDTLQLSARSQDAITWKSTNPEIATVDGTGIVTAIKKGEVGIVASSTKDSTLFSVTYLRVDDGRQLKKETYSNFINFEFKRVPVRCYYRGTYRHDETGKLVLGNWVPDKYDYEKDEYTYVNKGEIHELREINVYYYLAPDAASLAKNIDFERSEIHPNFSYKGKPTTIISVNDTAWNNPSFDVTGEKTKRFYSHSYEGPVRFDYTDFRNGVIVDGDDDPIFDPYEGESAYEYVYPDEFVQAPIFGYRFSSSSNYYSGNTRKAADNISTEWRIKNLIDMNSFHIFNVTGTLYTK